MSEQGTLGVMFIPQFNFSCFTLELPWRDNAPNKSCIPCGEYFAIPCLSAKFGQTYLLKNVPGRSGILIHKGNLAGDRDKGFISHSSGCILLGHKVGKINNQLAILMSISAVTDFNQVVGNNNFVLTIKEEARC